MIIPKSSTVPAAKQKLPKKSQELVTSVISPGHKGTRKSTSEKHSSSPVISTKSIPSKSALGKDGPKGVLDETITREEMKKKKSTFGVSTMERKKQKSRETEKSARKGVKAKLVGKLKA